MRVNRKPGPGRLAIRFGAAFALAMLLLGLIGFGVADAWVSHRIDSDLARHAAKYVAPIGGRAATDADVLARILDWRKRKVMSERSYMLFAANGQRIVGGLDIARPPTGYSDVRFKGGGHAYQIGRALTTRLPDGSALVIVQHSEVAASLHALLPRVVLVAALAAIVMGVAATYLFAHQTARRLVDTQETADAIAAGDLSRRIPMERLDGMFAVQAHSLNRMLDRMEELVKA